MRKKVIILIKNNWGNVRILKKTCNFFYSKQGYEEKMSKFCGKKPQNLRKTTILENSKLSKK